MKEVIIVDDHSTDETREIIASIAKQTKSSIAIKLFNNPKKGACSARNHAFQQAKGNFIQWLDADDILSAGKIASQLEVLQQTPNGLAVCEWQRFDAMTGADYPREHFWVQPNRSFTPISWISQNPMTIPACWLGSKSIFEKTGSWDESLALNQDGEYFTRAASKAEIILTSNQIKVKYRSGLENSTSRITESKIPSLFKTSISYEQVLRSISDGQEADLAIANHYQRFIYRSYPFHPQLLTQAKRKLSGLPSPNIQPDMLLSPASRILGTLFGWCFVVKLRLIRNRLQQQTQK